MSSCGPLKDHWIHIGMDASCMGCSSRARCVAVSSSDRDRVVEGSLQLLNVQVPLLFKQVIDALNLDVHQVSTAWVVAGSLILGCES